MLSKTSSQADKLWKLGKKHVDFQNMIKVLSEISEELTKILKSGSPFVCLSEESLKFLLTRDLFCYNLSNF